jgi:hypothetical protein
MSIETDVDLKAAFEGREQKAGAAAPHHERTKWDKPKPALRPTGSWRRMADAVDQAVRESQDAAAARRNEWKTRPDNEWSAGMKGHRRGKGFGYGYRRGSE